MSEHAEREALLYVRAGDADYGIPVSWVAEVIPAPAVTILPGQPSGICGICLYQGQFLTVFSMGELCGAAQDEPFAVVCRRDSVSYVLRVTEVGQLIVDGGPADSEIRQEMSLPVRYVAQSTPPVFVLDMEGMIDRYRA